MKQSELQELPVLVSREQNPEYMERKLTELLSDDVFQNSIPFVNKVSFLQFRDGSSSEWHQKFLHLLDVLLRIVQDKKFVIWIGKKVSFLKEDEISSIPRHFVL